MKLTFTLEGASFEVFVDHKARTLTVDGERFPLEAEGVRLLGPGRAAIDGREMAFLIGDLDLLAGEADAAAASHVRVKPPMTGKLEAMRVAVGQSVAKGDVLFVLEAMKMLNEVRAPSAGTVTAIHLKPGATLETHQVVLDLGPGQAHG